MGKEKSKVRKTHLDVLPERDQTSTPGLRILCLIAALMVVLPFIYSAICSFRLVMGYVHDMYGIGTMLSFLGTVTFGTILFVSITGLVAKNNSVSSRFVIMYPLNH